MSLGAIPISLLVPPTDLVLPCAAGLLIAAWRFRTGYVLAVAAFGGLLLLSLPYVSKTLIVSLERGLPLDAPPGHPPSAIVILSGDASRDQGVLSVGGLTLERERTGAALHRKSGLPILVTGGVIGDTQSTFAALMASSLQADFQVPVRWMEPQAEDTMQSGPLSAAILRREGVTSVYLVTHAWHMQRSLLAFAGTGLTVTAAPVRMDTLPSGEAADFFPRASAWLDSYYALHEWLGYAADATWFAAPKT